MRVLKLFVLSIIIFSILVLLLSLLFPSRVRVARAAAIRAPQSEMLSKLSDLRMWSQWNEMVSNPALTGVSVSHSKFQSDQFQIAMEETTSAKHLWLKNGIAIEGGFNLIPSNGDTTILQWYMDFPISWYPWEKFGSILYDKQIGPVMERSLQKFKKMAEDSL